MGLAMGLADKFDAAKDKLTDTKDHLKKDADVHTDHTEGGAPTTGSV